MLNYFIFEGPDGVGKTTLIKKVKEVLDSKFKFDDDRIIITRSPGYTEFGATIRNLVLMNPGIDSLTRQILYMADTVNYYESFFNKQDLQHKIILQDRTSYISSVVYGVSDGVPLASLTKALSVYKPPKCSKLFIVNVPRDITKERKKMDAGRIDYFETKPKSFHDSVDKAYASLITDKTLRLITSDIVHLENVVNVDNIDLDHAVNKIQNIISDHLTANTGDI